MAMKNKPTMALSELLRDLTSNPIDIKDCKVSDITLDSRQVGPGSVFFALSGSQQHGLEFAKKAMDQGVAAIIFDPAGKGQELANKVTDTILVKCERLRTKLGAIADRFYRRPSTKLDVIGCTGTNGKTSCSHFLAQTLNDAAVIGTLGWGDWRQLNKTENTTPDVLSTHKILAELVRQRKKAVAIEVSSHGLDQGRVDAVHFKGALYTRITRDHLDYHQTMDAYVEAKLKLLQQPGLQFVVFNRQDKYAQIIVQNSPLNVQLWGYSVGAAPDLPGYLLLAEDLTHTSKGLSFTVRERQQTASLNVPLFGLFNVENALAVMAVLRALGFSFDDAIAEINQLLPVTGRMDMFKTEALLPTVIIDYAHTPHALESVLTSVKDHCQGHIWLIFGCGGDRDEGKRPMMGIVAEALSDHVVVTDDNPRNESGDKIIEGILAGCKKTTTQVIRGRKEAIRQVVSLAKKDDIILIAGKGHEGFQEIKGSYIPFNDKAVAYEVMRQEYL
ncbi:MAG: UDP-N-acetylmuramoyl-L-alanyl-D-glutamate--2,6-diaminopimelate ligase [Methylococcaceae bacterium]